MQASQQDYGRANMIPLLSGRQQSMTHTLKFPETQGKYRRIRCKYLFSCRTKQETGRTTLSNLFAQLTYLLGGCSGGVGFLGYGFPLYFFSVGQCSDFGCLAPSLALKSCSWKPSLLNL